MVQNTSDGKLVEQEGGGEGGKRSSVGGVHVDSDEKMDSLQMEYTYLLTSQVIYPLHCRKTKNGCVLPSLLHRRLYGCQVRAKKCHNIDAYCCYRSHLFKIDFIVLDMLLLLPAS